MADNSIQNAIASAVIALSASILVLLLPVPTSAVPLLEVVLKHDGLIGGILAFTGALIAGYWAFRATSENTRNLVRVENINRNEKIAHDLRATSSNLYAIQFAIRSQYARYLYAKEYPLSAVPDFSDTIISKYVGERPALTSIPPYEIEYEINAAYSLLSSAMTVL